MSHGTTSNANHARRPGLSGRLSAVVYDQVTAAMERQIFGAERHRLLEAARGQVLDVGAGTGANLPHYPWDHLSRSLAKQSAMLGIDDNLFHHRIISTRNG